MISSHIAEYIHGNITVQTFHVTSGHSLVLQTYGEIHQHATGDMQSGETYCLHLYPVTSYDHVGEAP